MISRETKGGHDDGPMNDDRQTRHEEEEADESSLV